MQKSDQEADLGSMNRVSRRRHRSKAERRQIVEESLRPGVSVAVLARAHEVNANQIFHWRKMYREGRLDAPGSETQLLPVRVTEVIRKATPSRETHAGAIHIEVGGASLRVEGKVDVEALRILMEYLR